MKKRSVFSHFKCSNDEKISFLQRVDHLRETQGAASAIEFILDLTSSDRLKAQLLSQSWEILAELYAEIEQWHNAISAFSKASKDIITSNHEIDITFKEAAKLANTGKLRSSALMHCKLLALQPNHHHGLRNFAVVLKRINCLNDGKKYIERYLDFYPNCADGLNTYGTILSALGQHEDAIMAFRHSLEIRGDHAESLCNLANEYHLRADIDHAYIFSSRSISLSPRHLGLWIDQLTYLRRACAFDRLSQIDWLKVASKVSTEQLDQSFLQLLASIENDDHKSNLTRLIYAWGDKQLQQLNTNPPSELNTKDRKLRIGFVSGDFRNHSVARFIWPLFDHLDRSRYELFGYSTYRVEDSWRARFDQHATGMRDVAALSPQELCRTIRADGIHILFDLTGFTKGSRTAAFAWRAAPVQISWLGFPGSSGLPQMDYLFLDRHLAPADPSLIREQALISPGTTVCFSQIDEVPITPEIPELVRGHLTLGTLNNSYKLTRSTISRWARVLQELPTAQFLFVRREFQSYWLRENLVNEFSRHGIERERIHFFNNRLAGRHYLDCYNEIDFTLDTFPVTGGTTTTDALWMGVPVVGLEGPNVHQRVCSAILHHAGHPEWIARSDDEFVRIALDLAADQPRRIALRQSLRDELKASLLCNTRQFAADFAATMESLRPASS